MTTRRLDLDVVGEQGDEEDKDDFMVEEMMRPGNAGWWAEAAAAESPEKQERSSQTDGEEIHGVGVDVLFPRGTAGVGGE
jgi:hypothetical protein